MSVFVHTEKELDTHKDIHVNFDSNIEPDLSSIDNILTVAQLMKQYEEDFLTLNASAQIAAIVDKNTSKSTISINDILLDAKKQQEDLN
jgi:hypothetical protein